MHDFKNIHITISLIVEQIFKINKFDENEISNEKLFSVSLDICFHNLNKYFATNLNQTPPNSLTNEDTTLIVATFTIFGILFDHYALRKGFFLLLIQGI